MGCSALGGRQAGVGPQHPRHGGAAGGGSAGAQGTRLKDRAQRPRALRSHLAGLAGRVYALCRRHMTDKQRLFLRGWSPPVADLVCDLVALVGALPELLRSSGTVSPLLSVCSEKSLVREKEIPLFVSLLLICSMQRSGIQCTKALSVCRCLRR